MNKHTSDMKQRNIQEIKTEVVNLIQKRFLSQSIVNLSEYSENAPETKKTTSEQKLGKPNAVDKKGYCE